MIRSYDFYEQLGRALPDEQYVVTVLNQQIKQFQHLQHKQGKQHKADAYDPVNEEWLEIKVDYTNYPNHFVERFSIYEERKDGGPWQYFSRGVKYYVFFYKQLQTIYVFETQVLMTKIEQLLAAEQIPEQSKCFVKQRNASYHTYGYKIPKQALDPICIKKLTLTQF